MGIFFEHSKIIDCSCVVKAEARQDLEIIPRKGMYRNAGPTCNN